MGRKRQKGYAGFEEALKTAGTAYRAFLAEGPVCCCPVRLDLATAIEEAKALDREFRSVGGKAAVMRVQRRGIAWKTKLVWP
jgi:hypothetical protein